MRRAPIVSMMGCAEKGVDEKKSMHNSDSGKTVYKMLIARKVLYILFLVERVLMMGSLSLAIM